jgi:hypothetical protein
VGAVEHQPPLRVRDARDVLLGASAVPGAARALSADRSSLVVVLVVADLARL